MAENTNFNNNELLIILKEKSGIQNDIEMIIEIISSNNGKILERHPPRILIVKVDNNTKETISKLPVVENVYSGSIQDTKKYQIDDKSSLVIEAWNLRKSKSFRERKSRRSDEGVSWDYHQKSSVEERLGSSSEKKGLGRRGCNIPVEDSNITSEGRVSTREAASPINTSQYMIGSVAVGIIIVDGPPGTNAKFSAQEITKIVAEVQEGSNILLNLSPAGAKLSFIYDINTIELNLNPSRVSDEKQWRNPTMSKLGYLPGNAGLYDYLQHLRTNKWPSITIDWAYIAFFTKYAADWFAYASVGGPRLVMQYDNNGWGPDQIDRVFAHESGHIFGAPDEYSNSNCNTGGSWGYLGVSNCNCEVNNPSSIDCIMKSNSPSICNCSIGHFGWRDTDNNGIPDPIDG
jgi:hypothetical protein